MSNTKTTRSFFQPILFGLLTTLTGALSAQPTQESVVDRTSSIQSVATEFKLADGPAWNGWALMIPDVVGQKLYRYIPSKKQMQVVMPEAGRISATFINHGRLYLSDNPNGQIVFHDGKKLTPVANFESVKQPNEKPYRPNDLVVDNEGGIYVTFTPQNKVVYIRPDGQTVVAVENVKTPNGITLSPDQSTLYVSSFVPKKIWAYDVVAPGKTANERLLGKMDDGPERGADGMTIDRAGNIYCAGPSDIWIWNPAGKLIDKIACPTKPINCTFGDQDMRTLYITGPGGLHAQRMKVAGRSPQPPSVALNPPVKFPRKPNPDIPSTKIMGEVTPNLDVVYATYGHRKLLADIFVPKTANETDRLPGVVVVHGGGWHQGDKTKFRAIALELASRGYVTAAIEYRLADEAAFPSAIFDCTAAVRFLRANADKYAIDPDKIGAVGGSAGGHLVGLLASGGANPDLQGPGGNAGESARIQASVVMAGPLEMTTGSVAERSRKPNSNSNSNRWLRGTIDEVPELYRLADAHVQIDKQTCPILFMAGELDNPSRNARSREKLKSLGIETGIKVYPGAKHGCWNRQPWFDQWVEDIDQFLAKHLK